MTAKHNTKFSSVVDHFFFEDASITIIFLVTHIQKNSRPVNVFYWIDFCLPVNSRSVGRSAFLSIGASSELVKISAIFNPTTQKKFFFRHVLVDFDPESRKKKSWKCLHDRRCFNRLLWRVKTSKSKGGKRGNNGRRKENTRRTITKTARGREKKGYEISFTSSHTKITSSASFYKVERESLLEPAAGQTWLVKSFPDNFYSWV